MMRTAILMRTATLTRTALTQAAGLPTIALRTLAALLVFAGPFLLTTAGLGAIAAAQDLEADEAEDLEGDEDESLELSAPTMPLSTSTTSSDEEEVDEDAEGDPAIPSPEEAAQTLATTAPDDMVPTEDSGWRAPATNLTVNGYLRFRTEYFDTLHLGMSVSPFNVFEPADALDDLGSDAAATRTAVNAGDSLTSSSMRVRLAPTIALGEDVKVHTEFDLLDNWVMGSNGSEFYTYEQLYEDDGRFSLRDAIVVRRAYAEVTNRGLGQLRFGRMGSHWGLGLLENGGDALDDDFETNVDRVLAITKIAGHYFSAALDFPLEGHVRSVDALGLPIDASQRDDVDQYTFSVSRRMDEEEEESALRNGEAVFNYGAYLIYRTQEYASVPAAVDASTSPEGFVYQYRGSEFLVPDVWAQLKYGSLRLELEAVMPFGSIEQYQSAGETNTKNIDVLSFGGALEVEYRMLDDKLALRFYTGGATGDGSGKGLNRPYVREGEDELHAFRFHPAYRVDLILFRQLMRQITGAWYLKPGLGYDFVRSAFGQLIGIRADAIFSRASVAKQAWGDSGNLGIELDASLYYRSEDGPELTDGFHAQLDYGILFPLDGLQVAGQPSTETAQTLRLLLGVEF